MGSKFEVKGQSLEKEKYKKKSFSHMLTKCASNYIKARPKWSHMPAFLLYNRPMGHREWSVGAGGKTTDSLPTTHTDGPLSVTHRLTCRPVV